MNLGPFGGLLMCFVFVGFYFVQSEDQAENQQSVASGKHVCEGDVEVCKNGGKCLPNDSKRGYRCKCPRKYVGKNCQQINYCNALPCENKGECINMRDGHKCRCERPYYGRNCQLMQVNHCASLPCHNGGECVLLGDGFRCRCRPEYTGELCEEDRGFEEKCRNISDHLAPKCCRILNKCCINDPRDFVCGSWPSGTHAVLYYNKCELKKARCLDLSQCILKRNYTSCEGDHIPVMTRPTPCEPCPCNRKVSPARGSFHNIYQVLGIQETLYETRNCSAVKCDTPPPHIPFCLREARKNIEPKSIWDLLK